MTTTYEDHLCHRDGGCPATEADDYLSFQPHHEYEDVTCPECVRSVLRWCETRLAREVKLKALLESRLREGAGRG